jgi:hypothetical protein
MSPQQPSWKQEARQDAPAAEPETKPADQTPETPGENK